MVRDDSGPVTARVERRGRGVSGSAVAPSVCAFLEDAADFFDLRDGILNVTTRERRFRLGGVGELSLEAAAEPGKLLRPVARLPPRPLPLPRVVRLGVAIASEDSGQRMI